MIPSLRTQFDDAQADRMTTPDRVAEGIWSIPVAMPDARNPYSFCYAIEGGDGSLHLLDPGFDTNENWSRLLRDLSEFGLRIDRVASVLITHLHADHRGMADRVRAATGAPVIMLGEEQDAITRLSAARADLDARVDEWGVPDDRRDEIRGNWEVGGTEDVLIADRLLQDGDRWGVADRDLGLIATPGHTPGHACIVDRASGVFFSGDHVLPNIYSGLGLGGPTAMNPIADYFGSLSRVEEFDGFEVAPGHGYRFFGLAERCEALRAHHLRRSRETARVVEDRPGASVFDVASRLTWTAGWENLRGLLLFSALSQTELHLDFVRSVDYPEG